jgi:hypothetical protein
MRLLVASAVLCFLIGAPTFAQQEQQQQDEKAKQQDEKKKEPQEPKAEKKQQEEPAKQQDDRAKQEDKAKQDKQQQETTRQKEKQQKEMEKQQSAQDRQTEQQRQSEQRTGAGQAREEQPASQANRGGRRIPDDRFRASFGREHHFHIGIRAGERHFAYGGYSFEFVDAWPAGWSYSDDFYIDYAGDEYYLCDVEHPEVRLVVIIVD